MHNPQHPGEIIHELCTEPLGLTVTGTAEALGVCRKALSELLNGKSGVSTEMAISVSLAFETSAESSLNRQAQYNLWIASRNASGLSGQAFQSIAENLS